MIYRSPVRSAPPLLLAFGGAVLLLTSPWIAFAQQPVPTPQPALASASNPTAVPLLDLQSDTWAGTDALGRTLVTDAQARPARKDRYVGVFYFLTHGAKEYYSDAARDPKKRLSEGIYGEDPRILRDNTEIIRRVGGSPVTKPEGWKDGGAYWWGEPAVGYYLEDDPWVARQNLQMLADAGVDVIICDITNGPQYPNAYHTVFGVAEEMRRQGLATPQFAFITASSSGPCTDEIYDNLYAKGLYKDLWFQWEGKPLIFGDKNGSKPNTAPPRPEVRAFFNWRYSWAYTRGPDGNSKDEWEWADSGDPQLFGWHDDPKVPEEVAVLAGGWANGDLGRSFDGGDQPWGRQGHEPPLDDQFLAADRAEGHFFAQQWDAALQIDPKFVFVTGWNEWTAGRQYHPGVKMLGQVTKPGQYYFVDNFNAEFSRDLMPMKGGYTDNYYMQFVDYVRRFKGVRPPPISHGFHRIGLNDSFNVWQSVEPVYHDAVGDTAHRDWPGWGGRRYTADSGRNDIVEARVACDEKNVYFYVRTQDRLTPSSDPRWMQLLIDSDQNAKTGWHGYDYIVDSQVMDDHTTTLKRVSDGRISPVNYRTADNRLMITIPRDLLGMNDLERTAFDFHWVDNAPAGEGDIADWWYEGDSAPDGRFNYRFTNQSAGPTL